MENLLVKNISELVTNGPMVSEKKFTKLFDEDLGIIKNAWLHIQDGKVKEFGTDAPPMVSDDFEIVDAQNQLVMPGLVDSHTHPVFYGDRSNEFYQRLNGVSYAEIAEKGGGIKASMKYTKEASYDNLKKKTNDHLDYFLSFGVTTVEAKSGYGLSVEEEIRHLKILKELKSEVSQTIKTTCLVLHAIPEEYKSESEYIEKVGLPVLNQTIEEDLADFVDAFIETGYFSVENTRNFFEVAKKSGLKIRLHADEFTDAGAASFSADLHASSSDHLQFANEQGIKEMAHKGVVATILPGTSIYTNIPFTDGRKFADAGCAVAIATDFNPGSCVIGNLPELATISGLHCGLRPSEIIAGVTFVAAKALDLQESKGALAKGYDADFIIHPSSSVAGWLSDIGRTKPQSVFISGKKVI